jgi:hypothetical protein
VRESVYLARLGLMMLSGLPMKIIKADEFYDLDDVMQALILKTLHENWPDYDPDGEKTKGGLERTFVVRDDWDLEDLPEGPKLVTAGPSLIADMLGVPKVKGAQELEKKESDISGLMDPEREAETGIGRNDSELDLGPLEDVVPFYGADPEGMFEGELRHELVRAARHT